MLPQISSREASNDPVAPARVERLFAYHYLHDDLGFLDVDHSPELFRVEHLLEERAALVVGAPWLGKTTAARQLNGWLRSQPTDVCFGRYLSLTELGMHGGERELPPAWWEEWRQVTPAPRACWILDALDQGEERHHGVTDRILREIRILDDDHRNNLRLLLFSRQRDWLAEFRASLGKLYSLGPLRELPEFQLAPLHEEAARKLVSQELGASESFDRIANLIREFDLRTVAGFPVALAFLCRQSKRTDLSVVTVWRGILEELLREPDLIRRRTLQTDPDDRFAAAARVAALLTLSDNEQVIDHSFLPDIPTFADMFPFTAEGKTMRRAARDACEVGPFLNTPERGYRFLQRNVQDWLAAFGLARLSLSPLRSALCDHHGKLFPRHRELLALLKSVSEDKAVRDWIGRLSGGLPILSDLIRPSLAESLSCIDQLEGLAVTAPSAIQAYNADLGRLLTPGLGKELAARLLTHDRHPAAKELLLNVAMATEPYPVLSTAVELIADTGQPMTLRRQALLLVELHGGDAHFCQLAIPVGKSQGQTKAEHLLRATVIRRLVQRRLWTVPEAAAHAPPAEAHVIDDRHMLLQLLRERMSKDDARTLLRNRHQTGASLRRLVIDHYHQLDLLKAAALRLLAEDGLDAADQLTLTEVALEPGDRDRSLDLAFKVLHSFGKNPEVRRRFFEYGVQSHRLDPLSGQTWRYALRDDDLQWLLGQARGEWKDLPYVWEEVYRMARAVKERGQLEETAWEEICRLVELHLPGVQDRFEQNLQARERLLQREMEMEELRQERQPAPLSELVKHYLDRLDLSADERMRRLSRLCFSTDPLPSNLTGRWEDLDAELRVRVRAAIRQGLEQATPTAVPDGNEFPGAVLYEAQAFLDVLNDSEQTGWLNDERLQRWLPSALFALHDQIPHLIRRCSPINPGATLAILLDAGERELRSGFRYAIRASQIPLELWNNAEVPDRIAGWARNENFPAEARTHLLELLVLRAPSAAQPIAVEWSELSTSGLDETAILHRAGLVCRLVLDPAGTWPLIEEAYQHRGGHVLEELESLCEIRGELRVDLSAWPTDRLEALGRLLFETYPVASDPDHDGGPYPVTRATELRYVRDKVVGLLLHRDTREARAALKRLGGRDPGLRRLLRANLARRQAEEVIGVLGAPPPDDQSSVPLAEAVRLLDRADYRLIRSADNLLEAVLVILRRVGEDIAADHPMLYGKPPRRRNARGLSLPRKHLDEDALQSYVRRRLTDLLPQFVREAKVVVLREDQVRFRRKLDLRVIAPCLGCRELATVVIEVKWSDNPETESHLVEQLGRKYLLGEQLTHGIYLVGWCGKWRLSGSGRRRRNDREELEEHLIKQRDRYLTKRPGVLLVIEPMVLGLEWRETPRPASPSSSAFFGAKTKRRDARRKINARGITRKSSKRRPTIERGKKVDYRKTRRKGKGPIALSKLPRETIP